ncbi:MAG: hypothetical protein LBI14_04160 [Treponema sp.]|jgi:hypothetical protein|nr:hypothetical protein [Treponema sp.]
MKAIICICLVLIVSCGPHPIRGAYTPVLPPLPTAWEEIMGKPHWRLEWLTGDGKWRSWEGKNPPAIDLMEEWANPVLAWPFWPEKGIYPGIMRPAGGLFPWDITGYCLNLSWKAGIDANFWKELAASSDLQQSSGTPRHPWLFDWPRFRELFSEGTVDPDILSDPWLADWSFIAQKTVESGFDRRRIKAEPRIEIAIPSLETFWAGSSPFAEPISIAMGEPLVLLVGELPETWVSGAGQLRCHKGAWVFRAWEK